MYTKEQEEAALEEKYHLFCKFRQIFFACYRKMVYTIME